MSKTRTKKTSKRAVEIPIDGPETTILDYLSKQYRPYSTTDIIQNLHGEIGKAAAVKAIEALVSDGKIVSKMYGKVVVSCANKVDPEDGETKESVDATLVTLNGKLTDVQQKILTLEEELNDLTKYPDDQALDAEIAELRKKIAILENRLSAASSKPSLSAESVEKMSALREHITKESKRRIRMYNSFIKFLAEFIEPRKLIKELALEEPAFKN